MFLYVGVCALYVVRTSHIGLLSVSFFLHVRIFLQLKDSLAIWHYCIF